MGGRGGSSGMGSGGIAKASSEQRRIMSNIEKANAKRPEFSEATFKMNKDGSVSYEFTKIKIVRYAHGGKMISSEKDDIYERKEHYSGKIMPDGLRRANKTTKEDTQIGRAHV